MYVCVCMRTSVILLDTCIYIYILQGIEEINYFLTHVQIFKSLIASYLKREEKQNENQTMYSAKTLAKLLLKMFKS